MQRYLLPTVLSLLIMTPAGLQAQDHRHARQASPYAGFETRKIKSLSEEDISELKKGAGWGLALAAELNGIPGPSHLLILKDELGLSPDQVTRIEAIYSEMKAEAIAAGDRFIAAERAIEKAVVGGRLDERQLRVLVEKAAAARADLRFVHLSRHLSTPPLLTEEQIERYKALRGYASLSPPANISEDHGANMERLHGKHD
ncbi:Spy/CpxP family protein refolding chaperone [Chelativorans xinjiangense]|uniref:Spy/CpxP family protein refolding chaperone n=1 Tax=Chelativorans xinjiangense TaxID=2681485 RepID=UPI00135A374C|nr:hypothetical protein [Chelativorans xinjiangense]